MLLLLFQIDVVSCGVDLACKAKKEQMMMMVNVLVIEVVVLVVTLVPIVRA